MEKKGSNSKFDHHVRELVGIWKHQKEMIAFKDRKKWGPLY
jgi:hypothetical protein